MPIPVRRSGAVVLAVLAVFGLLRTQASAQPRPTTPTVSLLNPALNPNPFVNPLASISRFNAAVLGQSLRNQAAILANNNYGAGLNYGALATTNGGGLGYGALNPGYGGYGLGYGSLLNGGGYGANGASGYGASGYGASGSSATQWMLNPYEGYLTGAASLTTANARYLTTIQQAKLQREEAVRSAYKSRRAEIEEAEYERAHMADPEKIRQQQLARELDRARVSPPLTEVLSGKSLNTLLRNAIAQQARMVRGPNVPLSEDTLRAINLTAGDTRGNVGLLKDNGNLQWPQPLAGEAFKETRENLGRFMRHAVSTAQLNRGPDEDALNNLQADLKKLNETLDAGVCSLSPDQYIEAKRYLTLLGHTVTALKDRNVSNYFNGNWSARGKSVAELVKFMADKGLQFAPATPSDETAYLALYHALAAFDSGMPRLATGSNSSSESGNGDK